MSEPIFSNARLSRALCELLSGWVPVQRWSSSGGAAVELHAVAHYWLAEMPEGAPGISILLTRDEAPRAQGNSPILYQIPLVIERDQPTEPAALIGQVEGTNLFVSDGCAHPAGARALLEFIVRARQLPGCALRGLPAANPRRRQHTSARILAERIDQYAPRVLSGEQSNTSIIFTADGAAALPPLIMKIFRVLHPGDNPDVMVQSALAHSGCNRVPTPVGSLRLNWHLDDCDVSGDSAFAQELIPGAADAWQLFVQAAATGESMADPARELGEVTAEIHRALAQSLGERPCSAAAKKALITAWSARAESALEDLRAYLAADPHRAQTPAGAAAAHILESREQIEAIFAAGARAHWPALQRIHGDYHLGQILSSPHRGWIVLDFEGEPLRPLAERNEPDLPARDIAGMLRSFAYAAAQGRRANNASEAADGEHWRAECAQAFLSGYFGQTAARLRALDPITLALELDKALYEVSYEARQRPAWIQVPIDGVMGILQRAGQAHLTANCSAAGDNRNSGIDGAASSDTIRNAHPHNDAAAGRTISEE